ncbi:GNAT family N-acetyltransferase [Salinifilum aidingensis]
MDTSFPLRTPRVLIRPFAPHDQPAIHAVYADPRVMRYVGHGRPMTAEQTTALLEHAECHQREHGFAVWALLDRGTGGITGDIGFETTTHGVEFGYTLARAAWGRGLATEAARACLQHAFHTLDLPEVYALVDPRNTASARVLDKLGFTYHRTRSTHGRPHHEYRRARAHPPAP